jgi:hypothetical protein
MAYDITRYEKMYRKLVSLYPRSFRERVGESMEQTFRDLCRERQEAGEGLIGFALWTYADTFIGVIKAEINTSMKSTAFKLVLATNIFALAFLFVTWWVNGRDDTWLYLVSAAIVLSSFLYITPPKKD